MQRKYPDTNNSYQKINYYRTMHCRIITFKVYTEQMEYFEREVDSYVNLDKNLEGHPALDP